MNASWRATGVLAALLVSIALWANASSIVFAALAVWALKDASAAIRAMSLAVVIKFLNPILVTFSAASGGLFWLVLMIGVVRLLPTLRQRDTRALWPIWLFSLVAAILSIAASPALTISLMKLIAFVLIVSSVLVAINSLGIEQHVALVRWYNALALAVAGLSALTLLRPDAAFLAADLTTGRGLRGIFNHPQTLGIFLAPFVARDTAALLLMRERRRWLQIAIAFAMWLVMFLTQARTAAIAATLGVIVAVAVHLFRGRKTAKHVGTPTVIGTLFAVALVATIAATASGQLSRTVTGFLMKREGTQSLSNAFYASRGAGIEIQWQHFLAAPLTGHGFGVYADGQFPDGVVEIAGIPISAPVEKGFVPTTLLEETGIIGFVLFGVVAFKLLAAGWRNADLRWLALLVTCLLVNVGEAVILSPSGNGLLVWAFIGLSITASRTFAATPTTDERRTDALPLRPANLME